MIYKFSFHPQKISQLNRTRLQELQRHSPALAVSNTILHVYLKSSHISRNETKIYVNNTTTKGNTVKHWKRNINQANRRKIRRFQSVHLFGTLIFTLKHLSYWLDRPTRKSYENTVKCISELVVSSRILYFTLHECTNKNQKRRIQVILRFWISLLYFTIPTEWFTKLKITKV